MRKTPGVGAGGKLRRSPQNRRPRTPPALLAGPVGWPRGPPCGHAKGLAGAPAAKM